VGDDDTGDDCLYETECANPVVKTIPVGLGSTTNGDGPAAMGHRKMLSATPRSTISYLRVLCLVSCLWMR
jgi:hypothetical protein